MKILHGIIKWQTVIVLKSGQRLLKQIGVYITYETHKYVLIHVVLAVKFVVGLWNRVYYLCTLYVLKGEDRR